jgi:DNA-directed RNA polymerase alpha subunit
MNNSFFQKIDSSFQQSLTNLNLDECMELQMWLRGRVKYLKNIPHAKKKIQDLDLSIRAYNALLNNNLNTVEDVLRYGVDKVGLLKNIGQKTENEIRNAIEGKSI